VITCPRADALEARLAPLEYSASCRIVESGAGQQFSARTEAIRRTPAANVALHEDHAYPESSRGLLGGHPDHEHEFLFACPHLVPLPFRAHQARAYPAVFAICQTKSKTAEANLRHKPTDRVAGLNRFARLR
jgi:hypothetical protein